MNKKVALYARVSTDLQQGGMESQVRVLKAYCDQNNLSDFEFFTDEGDPPLEFLIPLRGPLLQ